MEVNHQTFLPIYQQVAEYLRSAIVSGQLKSGAQIPSEPELAVQFGISRDTVRRGLRTLEQQHLVCQRQGKGTFVMPQPASSEIKTRIGVIGLAPSSQNSQYTGDLMRGLQDTLFADHQHRGYLLPQMPQGLVQMLTSRQIYGLIISGSLLPANSRR